MTAKHTPAPWWRECETYVMASHGFIVARCAQGEDAKLAAASPELLEALQRLLNWGQRFSGGERAEDVAFARQAVAKALGEQP